MPVVELIPAKKVERIRALEQRQKELEAEFEKCFPALARKAKTMRPRPPSTSARALPRTAFRSRPDSVYSTASTSSPIIPPPPPFTATAEGAPGEPHEFTPIDWKKRAAEQDMNDEAFDRTKAPLVGPLAAGLDRMREAAAGATPSPPITSGKDKGSFDSYHHTNTESSGGYPEKLLEHESYTSPPPAMEGYEEIDPDMEGLRNDPAFQRAGLQGYHGSGSQLAAGSYDGSVGPGASVTSFGSASGGDGGGKKASGAGGSGSGTSARRRPQLWDRLTSRTSSGK